MSTVEKVYARPNPVTPAHPIVFDPARCNGCNLCVEVCPMDVFIPSPAKKSPPIVLFAEECWYCGCCVMDCPREGALAFNLPLVQRVRWKRKDDGRHYRL